MDEPNERSILCRFARAHASLRRGVSRRWRSNTDTSSQEQHTPESSHIAQALSLDVSAYVHTGFVWASSVELLRRKLWTGSTGALGRVIQHIQKRPKIQNGWLDFSRADFLPAALCCQAVCTTHAWHSFTIREGCPLMLMLLKTALLKSFFCTSTVRRAGSPSSIHL